MARIHDSPSLICRPRKPPAHAVRAALLVTYALDSASIILKFDSLDAATLLLHIARWCVRAEGARRGVWGWRSYSSLIRRSIIKSAATFAAVSPTVCVSWNNIARAGMIMRMMVRMVRGWRPQPQLVVQRQRLARVLYILFVPTDHHCLPANGSEGANC